MTGPMTGAEDRRAAYDTFETFEMMANGEMNGYICQGFNPLRPVSGSRQKIAMRKQAQSWYDGSLATRPSSLSGRISSAEILGRLRGASRTEVLQLHDDRFDEEKRLVSIRRWLQWAGRRPSRSGDATVASGS